jgi:hypothetical protein
VPRRKRVIKVRGNEVIGSKPVAKSRDFAKCDLCHSDMRADKLKLHKGNRYC